MHVVAGFNCASGAVEIFEITLGVQAGAPSQDAEQDHAGHGRPVWLYPVSYKKIWKCGPEKREAGGRPCGRGMQPPREQPII